VKATRGAEALLVRMLFSRLRAGAWTGSLAAGAALGAIAHDLGIRRRVAADNLARAFPERPAGERADLLRAHYRELGRVAAEYARLDELARAPEGEVIAALRGGEHLERARAAGRGGILLTGHFGNFELMGAVASRIWPIDCVVQPLANPGVEETIMRVRAAAGMRLIPATTGLRRMLQALRANRFIAVLADQDARRHGVFVPFLGRLASTPVGPARLSLAAGSPIITGFIHRRPDGRHEIDLEEPIAPPDPGDPDPVVTLTARHAARLERRVRERPEHWFWLHRRWKTAAPEAAPAAARDRVPGRAVAAARGE
jgi:KDO2-lipid IV(A) lauroyltransferase